MAGIDFAGSEIRGSAKYRERYHLRARRWVDIGYDGAIGFATVLIPFRGKMPDVTVSPKRLPGGEPFRAEAFEIRHPGGTDTVALNPSRLPSVTWNRRRLTARAWIKTSRQHRATIVR